MSTITTTVQAVEGRLEAVPPTLSTTAPAAQTQTETPAQDAQDVPVAGTEQPSKSVAALSTGGYPFAGMPSITDLYKKRQWQLEHMAGAFRVFARKGFTEGTAGHISVRDPVDPNTFWINP